MNATEINAIKSLAVKAAGDYLKSKGVNAGLTGLQHAKILAHVVCEWQSALADPAEPSDEDRVKLVIMMDALENGSTLRQKLEKNGLLGTGVRAGPMKDYSS